MDKEPPVESPTRRSTNEETDSGLFIESAQNSITTSNTHMGFLPVPTFPSSFEGFLDTRDTLSEIDEFVESVLVSEEQTNYTTPNKSNISTSRVQSPRPSPDVSRPNPLHYMTIKSPADPQAIQMARAALNPIPLSSLNIMPRTNRIAPLTISPSLLTDSESSLDPLDYSSEDSTQNGGKEKKKRKSGVRGPYNCGKCKVPKKGHRCDASQGSSETDENLAPTSTPSTPISKGQQTISKHNIIEIDSKMKNIENSANSLTPTRRSPRKNRK